MYLNKAFEDYNYNKAGLIVLSVFFDGSDADLRAYDSAKAGMNDGGTPVEYPSIAGSSGGAAITDTFGICSHPTTILIAPDGNIVEPDIWPDDVKGFDSTLALYSISKTVTPIRFGGNSFDKKCSAKKLSYRSGNFLVSLDASSVCELKVLSLEGRLFARRDLGQHAAGITSLPIGQLGLASGAYVFMLKTDRTEYALPVEVK